MPEKKIVLFEDDDSERELPSKWVICSDCRGNGASSAYLGAFTRDQMDEEGREFLEDYVAGRYDRTCDHCGGSGKVKVADYDRMSAADAAAYRAQEADRAAVDRIQRMERLMEGGWREEGWYNG